MAYPKLIESLIAKLMKLPGIGRRSAERIVFWLLENPTEAEVMGRSGREAVLRYYNWDREAKNLLELYEKLSGRAAGRDVCVSG